MNPEKNTLIKKGSRYIRRDSKRTITKVVPINSIRNNKINNIPDDSTTFYSSSNPMKYYRLNDIWSNALKVGVCYNDAPLNY